MTVNEYVGSTHIYIYIRKFVVVIVACKLFLLSLSLSLSLSLFQRMKRINANETPASSTLPCLPRAKTLARRATIPERPICGKRRSKPPGPKTSSRSALKSFAYLFRSARTVSIASTLKSRSQGVGSNALFESAAIPPRRHRPIQFSTVVFRPKSQRLLLTRNERYRLLFSPKRLFFYRL